VFGHLEGKQQTGNTAADYQDIGFNIAHDSALSIGYLHQR
jgi:hypothetical protein